MKIKVTLSAAEIRGLVWQHLASEGIKVEADRITAIIGFSNYGETAEFEGMEVEASPDELRD